jgi:hypothetical protein
VRVKSVPMKLLGLCATVVISSFELSCSGPRPKLVVAVRPKSGTKGRYGRCGGLAPWFDNGGGPGTRRPTGEPGEPYADVQDDVPVAHWRRRPTRTAPRRCPALVLAPASRLSFAALAAFSVPDAPSRSPQVLRV